MNAVRDVPPLPIETLPFEVYAHQFDLSANSRTAEHTHPWGQLDFALEGVLEMKVADRRYLSPQQYAVWIPPHFEHACTNVEAMRFCSIYISAELSERMPRFPCALEVNQIIRAIACDLVARDVPSPLVESDRRLMAVLVDQLAAARPKDDHLPYGSSPALRKILSSLQENPGDNRSIQEWAEMANVTERTLARMCRRELGMGLGQWRQQLRFVAARTALERKMQIEDIAFTLGYSSASAFITSFRSFAGTTPAQYKRSLMN
jgi:AraC-like DNA-binding protein